MLTAVAVMCGVGLAGAVAPAVPGFASVAMDVTQACRALAAAMFTGAGVLALTRSHVGSDSQAAMRGLALLVLGMVMWPLVGVVRTLTHQQPDSLLPALVRGAVTIVVLMLMASALRCATHGSGSVVDLPRMATRTGAVTAGVGAAALVCAGGMQVSVPAGRAFHVLVSAAVAVGWLGVALWARRAGDRVAWASSVRPCCSRWESPSCCAA